MFSTARLSLHRAALTTGALLLAIVVLAGCGGGESNASNGDDGPAYQLGEAISDTSIAAIVSSEYGTDTLQAQAFQQQMGMLMQQMPPNQMNDERRQELQRNILNQFATRHVLTGEARATGVQPDTAQVNMELRQMRGRFQNEEAFRQALASSNMTEDSLRILVRDRVRMRQMQQDMASSAEQPTADEVQQYREDQQQEEVRASHILFRVSQNAPSDTVDSVRARAESVLDSVQSGDIEFATAAERHSEGPTSSRGGDLGYFTKDRMVTPFADAAFALQDSGAVTNELVRTQYGFHIIQLTGRRMQELMDSTQARQAMMNERRRTAVEDARDELLSKATVRLNPDVVNAGLMN